MDAVPFHIGITTDDLGASMLALADALGVTWTTPTAGEGVFHTVDGVPQPRPISCVSRQGPIHLDLIEGRPGTIWESAGPRLHHFAYWTDDLATDVARLAAEGWRLEMTSPDAQGRPTLFAYLIREDGFRLELIDSAGRPHYQARLQAPS
ncbi:VOC family protein [Frankia sp. CNm7]|uniref:VOC family protein n=1 Tax=Frankia nepalensis TaxID=1836974 RepID=A0A937UM13_9ACTN|nr:VOC family protein [Frankia nepalensis]MBL7501709.1 VOC family protein [Frankia nepalensis]MBL7511567.1 VOC family protein [Frankia nepalensis]MBL7518577.1 VOC family protein [Frankia nepalensis]MBL7626593.1 VOC family protein [Frankia nepalensis]